MLRVLASVIGSSGKVALRLCRGAALAYNNKIGGGSRALRPLHLASILSR